MVRRMRRFIPRSRQPRVLDLLGKMDAAVGNELLDRLLGNFAPVRIEAGQDDRLGVPPDPGYKGHSGEAKTDRGSYTLHDIRKQVLWGNLMAGGGGVEYYFGYRLAENDLVAEDFRSRDQSWDYCRLALEFFARENCRLVILGSGEKKYEDLLREFAAANQGRVGLCVRHDEAMSHLVEAGSDFFVMPSLFEPCGLTQLIGLKYGTVPVVTAVGGLDDTVQPYTARARHANGFKFRDWRDRPGPTNLVNNAVQSGADDSPDRLRLDGARCDRRSRARARHRRRRLRRQAG